MNKLFETANQFQNYSGNVILGQDAEFNYQSSDLMILWKRAGPYFSCFQLHSLFYFIEIFQLKTQTLNVLLIWLKCVIQYYNPLRSVAHILRRTGLEWPSKSVTIYHCDNSTKITKFMGPTWVLSAPDEPHVGPMNLYIRVIVFICQGNSS